MTLGNLCYLYVNFINLRQINDVELRVNLKVGLEITITELFERRSQNCRNMLVFCQYHVLLVMLPHDYWARSNNQLIDQSSPT